MLRRSLAVVLALGVSGLASAGCGDDADPGDDRANQVRAAAIEAGLEQDIADFLGLAARGETATYQATYPGPEEGTRIVVANDPPDRRVDVLDGDVVTESRLVLGGEAFRCPRDAEQERIVRCERTDAVVEPPGVLDPGRLAEFARSLQERRRDFSFRLDRRPVAGVESSCLVTEIRPGRDRPDLGDDGTICVSPQGVLLLVDQSDESLEALDYTTDVPDGTFVRPDEDA